MADQRHEYGHATNDVTNQLRKEVLSGQYAAGDRIKIAEFAAQFKVSAMPVREALRTLEAEGLLQIVPNKGAIVRLVDEDFVRNIYDIRAALEVLLAERACLNMTFDTRRVLEEIQAKIEAAASAGDADGMMQLNAKFHSEINVLGRNPEAERLLALNQNIIVAFRRQFGFAEGRLNSIAEEHRAILNAMFRRDLAEATSLVRMHVVSARDDMIGCMRRGHKTG